MEEIYPQMELIESHCLFEGLHRNQIWEVIKLLDGVMMHFDQGDDLANMMQASGPKALGCMLSGWARHLRVDAWGNQAILDFVMPNYLLGCYNSMTTAKQFNTRVIATKPGMFLLINGEKLLNPVFIQQSLALCMVSINCSRLLAERSWRLLKKADVLSCRSLREKILRYLSYERDHFLRDTFEIPFDRQGLADYLYVDRSALSRELSRLRREGLIDFYKNRFTLKISDGTAEEK